MKKFNTSFSGYSKEEVNAFVNNVTIEYESMLNKLKSRDQEIVSLKKELERFKNLESTLNRAILIAEESSHSIKKTAFDESRLIIEDAKKNASRIINNALIKAEKVENDMNYLKRKVVQYKKRYKDLLEEQLDEIERLDVEN